jgi:hypothetical protein
MSINALTNAALARRPDFVPLNSVPKDFKQIAAAAGATTSSPQRAAPGGDENGNAINTALHVLFGYIPTEVLTLYVAILAVIQKPGHVTKADWIIFWVFLVATPVIVWLVFGAKLMSAEKPVPWAFEKWPLWEMCGATVAYAAWAFALPNTPFTDYGWYSPGLSGIGVLVASTVLGLLAPFFQKPLGS